ncbi:MAG: hypothetical protein COT16_01675 [Elusimicrobia bacterium CG08_land_8_20_14_0_20_44_26]|nr:MAG: hypothetical protein COT16_01675 [Elusimicrobia bacterium CG08_land_8_20_14_0_20_44_26]
MTFQLSRPNPFHCDPFHCLRKIWRFLKPLNKKLLYPGLGLAYAFICRALMLTVKMKTIGYENEKKVVESGKKFIYGFWDGRQIMLFPFGIGKNLITIATTSDVGAILVIIHRFFTIKCLRGSSSSGGAGAMKGLIRNIKRGKNAAIAVDGPRGPNEIAKSGIIQLARLSGAVILPLTASVRKKVRFEKYWNRVFIPLPFTSGCYVIGRPIEVLPQTHRQEINKMLNLFQMELERITKIADEFY